ncbi:hypothetical protein A2154_00100 [Candidatus Gottesmanbacteria bacterium RBG_16_43_7]|uniref:Methyltransferase type 12 n=1 Tax=Candidatus Gottesmanbacteria bacterium RBG_16_43_7 TaxID=1798373 RepID=A0A1F5Z9X4_9BACT|nr:MAG: hypothetical protein A2154_00100 [Candidatus Gottesmanbacteria bacterium RBG_16_43_7]
MQKLKCYLCAQRVSPYLVKNGYTLFQCQTCGLIQTDLKKEYQKFVKEYYDKGYFTGDPKYCAYDEYERDKVYILANLKKMFGRLANYLGQGTLLDVGCAMGHLVKYANTRGWDAYGFDPSAYALSRVPQEYKYKVKNGTIDTVSYKPGMFDAVTMLDVIEHLKDPVGNLKKVRTFLKDDGYLVIATGDIRSAAAKLFAKHWTFFNPPQHLFFFSKKTLSEVLRISGFKPIEWFTLGKWLSLGYTLHLGRSVAESRLAGKLYNVIMKFKLGKLPLFIPMNDNMVVIAKKVKS